MTTWMPDAEQSNMTILRMNRTGLRLLLVWLFAAGVSFTEASSAATGADTLPPQVADINQAVEQVWRDYEIQPAPEADDAVWCRRVYLDIIGRIPTYDELTEFTGDRSAEKRAELVETLLYDDRYTEEYAQHWSNVWTNLLIGRSGGNDDDDMTSREGMQKYLRDSFARNKTYDQIVYELVTAVGSTTPGTPNFNGAVNFLVNKVNEEDATLATSSTSRIFLGQQVQCTQCHNHPFNQWKQQKFWEFNAFFRQTRALRRFVPGTDDVAYMELINEDFAGEINDPEDALIFYELRNGLQKVAYPVFTDGTEIGRSGFLEDVNRRDELGRLMLQSEYLDKMLVNRMWSMFLGHGFTRPIDDLGPHNPPSHPVLMDSLAAEFRENSYDLKKLITWITLSRPYQLAAILGPNNEIDDPAIGETPKFSRFYLRQMSAEQLYASLVTAADAKTGGTYEEQEEQRRRWLQQFVVAFGTDEGDEATTFNGSIPQALMLFNGDLIKNAIRTTPGSFLDRLSQTGRSPQERVTRLFQAGLARRPTKKEVQVAGQLLYARKNDEKEMLQDLWWAILNSNEFIMQH